MNRLFIIIRFEWMHANDLCDITDIVINYFDSLKRETQKLCMTRELFSGSEMLVIRASKISDLDESKNDGNLSHFLETRAIFDLTNQDSYKFVKRCIHLGFSSNFSPSIHPSSEPSFNPSYYSSINPSFYFSSASSDEFTSCSNVFKMLHLSLILVGGIASWKDCFLFGGFDTVSVSFSVEKLLLPSEEPSELSSGEVIVY